MAKIMTLSGTSDLGQSKKECKCVLNPRTGRSTKLCFVGKSAKSRSGWAFTGSCGPKAK